MATKYEFVSSDAFEDIDDIRIDPVRLFTFPNTTYYITIKWSQFINKLMEGFSHAKFKLDNEDVENDKHMYKLCKEFGEKWDMIKNINTWSIDVKNKRSVKINVKSRADSAVIVVNPFLDDECLVVEIRRWKGSSILMHRWLKYVLKYLDGFLHKR